MSERALFEGGQLHQEQRSRVSHLERRETAPTPREAIAQSGARTLALMELAAADSKKVGPRRESWLKRQFLTTGLAFGLAMAGAGGIRRAEAGFDARPVVIAVEQTMEEQQDQKLQQKLIEIDQKWEIKYHTDPGRPFARDLDQLERLEQSEQADLARADQDYTQARDMAIASRDGKMMDKIQDIYNKRLQAIRENYAKLMSPLRQRIEPYKIQYRRAREAEKDRAIQDARLAKERLRQTTQTVLDAMRRRPRSHR